MKTLEEMTMNEKTLRSIIIDFRNELIGGFENMTYDCSTEECEEYWPLKNRTKQYVVDYIYSLVMKGNDKYLTSSIRNIALEKKHIKFMGSQFVRDLIEDRVQSDYTKHGWNFENNYYGDLN